LADALQRYALEVSPTKRGQDFELLRIRAFLRHDAFPAHILLSDLQPEHLAQWRDARLAVVKAGSIRS